MTETAGSHHPYYKVFAWLTFFTIAEIIWSMPDGMPRGMLIAGLGVMATIKAALVGMYYMHLKYESKVILTVICFPLILIVVMVSGLLPDAIGYW